MSEKKEGKLHRIAPLTCPEERGKEGNGIKGEWKGRNEREMEGKEEGRGKEGKKKGMEGKRMSRE